MRLSEICVERPVFAFMLVMFLVVLGVSSFNQLGVDLFPRSDPATVNVRVDLPGASPEEVTSQVVMPLEEAIASVSGIDEITARVSEGYANITVTFVLERNISEASDDVREKVSGAMRILPPNVLQPTVTKADPDSDPVITLVMAGQRTARELTEIADKQVRRALETVDGVGGVDINGGQNRQIIVFLDLNKLSGYNLTARDIQVALQGENIETPGGRMVRGLTEVGVRTMGRVENVAEFNDIIVKNVGGSPIRLRDVGYVEDGMAEKRTFAQFHGQPAVTLEVRRQIGTNTVQVVDAIKKRLGAIRKQLPHGVTVEVVKDQAGYIKNSVKSLEEHLVLGSLLASFIVWLFIRDWRSVLISSIAIPTSIITTFTLIRAMDFTLNSMTLLGLTLAVGIVIDDAIIVLENIYRFTEPVWLDHGHVDPGLYAGGVHADSEPQREAAAQESRQGWQAEIARPARLLRSRLCGRAGMVVAASVAGGGNLRGDLRLDVRYQSSHRPGLDAAGRSERAEHLRRTSGRLFGRSGRRNVARSSP